MTKPLPPWPLDIRYQLPEVRFAEPEMSMPKAEDDGKDSESDLPPNCGHIAAPQ